MKIILSNLLSLILPVTVLILVPGWLTGFALKNWTLFTFLGIFLSCIGLAILIITISSFIKKGKGTLAPWSPTKKLIITGLHAYVRNPMILGVMIALGGEALIFSSPKILNWLIIFFIINHSYFLSLEEPSLSRRFGNDYEEYKRNVRRWIPRLKPYRQ
jgi:protein-S-isoprenylcysteine O-methyltransferase Ste14